MATKHLRGPSEMRHFPARAHPASVKKQLRPAEQSASSWQAPRPASPRGVVVVAVAVVVGVAAGAIGVAVDAARRPPLDGPRPTPESCLVVSSARHAASNERRSAMKCAKRATPSSYPVRPRMYDPVLGADDRRCKRPLSLCGDRRSFMAHGPRHPKHSARPGIEPRRAPHETVPTGLDLRRMRLRFCADAVAFGPARGQTGRRGEAGWSRFLASKSNPTPSRGCPRHPWERRHRLPEVANLARRAAAALPGLESPPHGL